MLRVSIENITGNYSLANSSKSFGLLLLGAVAFAHFIFLELVTAIISNVILVTLDNTVMCVQVQ